MHNRIYKEVAFLCWELHSNNTVRTMLILEKSAEFDIHGLEKVLQTQTTGELGRL